VGLLVGAAAAIQLRLVCNLLDGMVAVEGGKKSKTGDVFNDLPDRFADLLILVPVGYALDGRVFSHELGWLAGVLAVLTAYVRVLGGSLGLKQDFGGPMGKPQRMAVMTAACLLACFEPLLGWQGMVMETALVVIACGSAMTMVLRTKRILRELRLR
jgi:phosphatidylglycerophosphate synthase